MQIWHINFYYYSRAFANPPAWLKPYFLVRGWRPFNDMWWSKPSPALKKVLGS